MSQDVTLPERQALFTRIVNSRRVDLPGDVWLCLLDTLRVPEVRWQADASQISTILTISAIVYDSDADKEQRQASHRRLAEAGAHAVALFNGLLGLDGSAKVGFEYDAMALEVGREADAAARERLAEAEVPKTVADIMAGRFLRHERALRDVASIAIAATGGCPIPMRRVGRSARRLLDCPRECAFDLLVMMLYQSAAERGWHLTLSHNFESGTLVDTVRMVGPHLPRGLVPEHLSMKRLRALKARAFNTT
jgi:hypothetical protein